MNSIKKYRKMAKLKQKDLAALVGLTPSAISHYVIGLQERKKYHQRMW
ncbi:helix-turn-helix domain-containing protein [Xenorhabdus siamensis]